MLIKKGPDKIVSTYVLLVVILYRKPQGHPKKIVHIYNHNTYDIIEWWKMDRLVIVFFALEVVVSTKDVLRSVLHTENTIIVVENQRKGL